jgi:hypothetical protein
MTGSPIERLAPPDGAPSPAPWRAARPRADVRVGDRERAATAERLAAHAAAGRLTVEELEQRVERAHTAVVRRDLDALLADLPAASAGADAPGTALRRSRHSAAALGGAAAAALAATLALSVVVGHPLPPLFLLLLVVWRRFA